MLWYIFVYLCTVEEIKILYFDLNLPCYVFYWALCLQAQTWISFVFFQRMECILSSHNKMMLAQIYCWWPFPLCDVCKITEQVHVYKNITSCCWANEWSSLCVWNELIGQILGSGFCVELGALLWTAVFEPLLEGKCFGWEVKREPSCFNKLEEGLYINTRYHGKNENTETKNIVLYFLFSGTHSTVYVDDNETIISIFKRARTSLVISHVASSFMSSSIYILGAHIYL